MMVNDIWVVTSYFNPCRYLTKKSNFELFAARLRSIGANLLVIEMASNDGEFELGANLQLIRVRGNSMMWQKERLLNIAIEHLPASCTKVAWLDCDLLFEDNGWLRKTSDELERFAVVQPFSSCVRLRRDHLEFEGKGHQEERIAESFAAAFARDKLLARHAQYLDHGHTGFAWASRRDLLSACGLYDACLTGSGDHLMAHVFAGALDSHCIPAMIGSGNKYAEHFARWAAVAHHFVRGNLGHVPGRVLHLWHGTTAARRYYFHNQKFKTFDFDPDRDICRDENGLWNWNEAPAEMRAWANDMLISRDEDGASPSSPDDERQGPVRVRSAAHP